MDSLGKEMNLLHPPGIGPRSLDCLARRLGTKRTTLSCLLQSEIQTNTWYLCSCPFVCAGSWVGWAFDNLESDGEYSKCDISCPSDTILTAFLF